MTIEDRNYKLEILEYAVNQCIDRLLSKDSEDALSIILYRSNEVVWRVATDIYTKSGHQIDFVFIRDILNLRIEPLRNKIAEEERIKAQLEAQRQIREAEKKRIRKEKEAEKAKIRAKLEAERLAKIAEQERIEKARIEEEQRQLQELKKANPDVDINNYKELETFIRIKNIVIEQLEVGKEQIKLDTLFEYLIPESYNDWRNRMQREKTWCSSSSSIFDDRSADTIELIMAVEEEFDIEISDDEFENLLSWTISQLVNLVLQKI